LVNLTVPSQGYSDYLKTLSLTGASEAGNDTTYVDVVNISGAGILFSCGIGTLDPGGAWNVEITIDGGAAQELTLQDSNGLLFQSFPLQCAFTTSLRVRMKLGAVGTARYWAWYGVE